MPDVWLKHPETGDRFVVGNAIEAAQLRGRGYVDDDSPSDPEPPESTPPPVNEANTGSNGSPVVDDAPPAPTVPTGRGSKSKP